MAKNEPPLGSVGLSAFAVALIFVVWPIVMGGSVALAIAFGEEIGGNTAPEDANGFEWLYPDNTHLNGGSYCPSSQPASYVVLNPNGVSMDNATQINIGLAGQNDIGCKFPSEYILKIPSDLLDQEDSISKMRFEYLLNGYSTSSNAVNNRYTMDIELMINGESIFTEEDYEYRGSRRSSGNKWYGSIDFIHEFDGIEVMNLRAELDDCESSCNVTLTFSDIKEIFHQPYTQDAENFIDGYVRIDTWTTDADTEGFIMSISPWIVTGLTLLVAIGSTRFFNPLAGLIGGRF